AAEQFKALDLNHVIYKPDDESSAIAQDDEDVDETGRIQGHRIGYDSGWSFQVKGCVRALKAADGDIVAAIMDLTN
ncbi:hypothetical protein FRX31_019627, partial [Thalictrum thalictroides]